MTSPKAWRDKRKNKRFKAPSGDFYTVEIPDPISLIQFWVKECGLKQPLKEKSLGKSITENKEIVAKTLMRYVKKPLITISSTPASISINELMKDQTDSIAILRKIMQRFLTGGDSLLTFFRDLNPSSNGG